MRPRELTVRGFRSFADDTTFDFTGRGLVGIVGPIGAGKSSILDAVAFALYARTPRAGSETHELISQRRDSLHVQLVFEVDGAVWKVVRALRRKGAAAHALYRVESGTDIEVAAKARDVTERIEVLLGLDFEAFRRSVLLAQNQFAGFLEAKPTERNQVLKGVFGFDRLDTMRQRVKDRLDASGAALAALVARRASADADRRRMAALATALAAAEARRDTLEALRLSVLQAEEVVKAANSAAQAAAAAVAELVDLAARIPTPGDTAARFAEATATAAATEAARRTHEAAVEAVAHADAALEAALDAAGGRQALDSAADLVARLGAAGSHHQGAVARREVRAAEVVAAEQAVKADGEGLGAAEAAEAAAASALLVATTAEQEAREALHAAHEADRAAGLRHGLAVGVACPVCLRVVEAIPDGDGGGGVDAAEASVRAAVEAMAAARDRATAATAEVARRRAGLQAAEARHRDAVEALRLASDEVGVAGAEAAALGAEVADRLGDGDPQAALGAIRQRVASAEAAIRAARADETASRRTADEAAAARARADAALERLSATAAGLAGRLGLDLEPGEGAEGVAAMLRTLREEIVSRTGAASERRERAEAEAQAAGIARRDLLAGAGLAADDDIVQISHEAAREVTDLGAEARVIERNLAELDALGGVEAERLAERALLERLHTDLADAKFVKWVLDEQRRVLSDLAGTHLETLTAGRYRFTDDGEFAVVDLAAAELQRSSASLSGGETFLASLALALALAEIVSREGGRLDAFFLDEGFGSLDPEHLDLAMDGVERLVASGGDRLVVVVSHVPALRERFEDLIVLDRDPVTGVTKVRSGAGGPG